MFVTVDGAIHSAAGPKLHQYCKSLGGCNVGEAKLSPGFLLPAQYIVCHLAISFLHHVQLCMSHIFCPDSHSWANW